MEGNLTDGISTEEEDFVPLHKSEHGSKVFHFEETGGPITILILVFLISLLRLVFLRVHYVPHSVMLLIFGIVFGGGLSYVFHEDVFLQPQWFFFYLLPLIVLEAGYFMKNKDFFRNVGTITMFAVVGTLFNTSMIAMTLYFCQHWFSTKVSFIEIALFSTLICAVDPVAVLCVFEDIHVNEVLYIVVFGESLMNDAVTIVLYNTIINLVPTDLGVNGTVSSVDIHLGTLDYIFALLHFIKVSFGGIACGIIGGYATALVMRVFSTMYYYQQMQPINLLAVPLLVYFFTESMHLSAILALVTCGILIKNYMSGNVVEPIQTTIEFLLKTCSSYSEAAVFVFLGISVVSSNHVLDWPFVVITLIGCLAYRFIGVYAMTAIVNRFRDPHDMIRKKDQFVMAYGGLRGAVCYGLVMAIDGNIFPAKRMFVTTTLVVIVATTVLQGSSIKKIVDLLNVKRSKNYGKEEEKVTVFDYLSNEVNKNLQHFLEDLTGLHQQNYIFRKFLEFDDHYLKPFLIKGYKTRDPGIITHHLKIEFEEYTTTMRTGGSFAGLPTVCSYGNIQGMRTSKSEAVLTPHVRNASPEPFSPQPSERSHLIAPPPSQRSIPRNESISGIVKETFENMNRGSLRDKRRSVYSRHLMELFTPTVGFDDQEKEKDKDGVDLDNTFEGEEPPHLTYPYSKQSGKKLANNIRMFGKSIRDGKGSPGVRRPFSPSRASVSEGFKHPPSSARATAAPRPRLSLPTPDQIQLKKRNPPKISFSTMDETISVNDEPSSARNSRKERKISVGKKTFSIGSPDERELDPISEEQQLLSPEDFPARKRTRTHSSAN